MLVSDLAQITATSQAGAPCLSLHCHSLSQVLASIPLDTHEDCTFATNNDDEITL